MTASADAPRRSGCPINACLEIFGDRWSLLIVRDLMFRGRRTFKEFAEGGEGIATNVLADRLQRLADEGILRKQPDPDDRRRVTYELTAKGIELAPVLAEMVVWGARHEETDAPPATVRRIRRERERFLADVRSSWKARSGG